MSFNKRRFTSPGQLLSATLEIAKRPSVMAEVVTGRGALDAKTRERVMLAVTSVNKCRYCSFVHTLLALKEGNSCAEIDELLAGAVDGVADEERDALLYAQHWADTGGNPDSEARDKLIATYGEAKARAIEGAIRAIMFGNYFGNTFDYLLYTASGVRLAAKS